MKILHRDLQKDGSGSLGILLEEPEDMWHLYNLISIGDSVRASTVRRIQHTTTTGSKSSERKRITLTLKVQKIDFFEPDSGKLRISGINIVENPYVKMGGFHSIDLELESKLTLTKDNWDVISLERIDIASDPKKSADVAAIMITEGLANVCLIKPSMTVVVAKIEVSISKKRRGSTTTHDKTLNSFFDKVIQAILKHIDFNLVKCVLVAGPGFTRDQLITYMLAQAQIRGTDWKILLDNKSKFLSIHANGGHLHALKEVLTDESVQEKLADTKALGEVRRLNEFYQMMKQDVQRAFYGAKHVMFAHQQNAIQVLLITDELFRAMDLVERKKYVKLVEEVKENGGEVSMFSALHPSGEQLKQLGGIAAILRFPLSDEGLSGSETESEEEEEEKENEKGKEKVKD